MEHLKKIYVKIQKWLVDRPGTTIAAIGGVVLFVILLGLLIFYLCRQKKLKKKETLRRRRQEHEVREAKNAAYNLVNN